MTETERLKITEILPKIKPNQDKEEGEVPQPDIKLEEITRTIGYGNGDGRIKTEAFEIQVPLEIRQEIKEIMTRLGNNGGMPAGRYIPYGLVQTVGAEVYNAKATERLLDQLPTHSTLWHQPKCLATSDHRRRQ
jgi:hypothetical protein